MSAASKILFLTQENKIHIFNVSNARHFSLSIQGISERAGGRGGGVPM